MERRLVKRVKSKLAQWFNPLGKTPALDPKTASFQKPYESLEPSRFQPEPAGGGWGGKKESPHRIDEFHPRGAAGRRDIHASSGPRKNALPHRGNRTKNPK